MAPDPGSEAEYVRAKARKDLLILLEGVSKRHLRQLSLWLLELIVPRFEAKRISLLAGT
jgi:hypothetical protein